VLCDMKNDKNQARRRAEIFVVLIDLNARSEKKCRSFSMEKTIS
jgi:hypothetical protein